MGGGGEVDMRKIRVLRLRGVVWVELSPGRVCMDPCPGERVWGGCCMCLAERGSKAPGSKYLPRRCDPRTA